MTDVPVVDPNGLTGPLTLIPSIFPYVRETTTTQVKETVVIIFSPASTVLVEEKLVRTIPGPAGIVQAAKLLKQMDIVLGWDGDVMSTQEYMKKVVEDVDEDEDFKNGVWVSATEYVKANGGIVSGCLGDIKNFLKNGKLEQFVAIIKSCTPNALGDLTMTVKDLSRTIASAIHHKVINEGGYGKDITVESALILANVLVFSPKPSMHYLNITMKNMVKVFHKDSDPGNGSGIGLLECYSSKMVDEQSLNLALEEEARQARADYEWLEKCRKEEELDEEHERQL
uniref:Homologous recombination OB-fold protein OB-fold domain-containing protein n=1 Tax=Tanacetum cinerariifolium TaxID=118510 RepID=A0A699H177_TANCI|nr:hypothetical protein [Tanacetum cinerariifolium]